MNNLNKFLGITRIVFGFEFLWAFFDKTFGLGFATTAERAWINGGSPTSGFLAGVKGPLAGLFNSLSGMAIVDLLFMVGLLGIGLALVLGAQMKLATISVTVMLALMYLAVLPLANNPIIDEHLIYILLAWVLYYSHAENYFGMKKA